MLRVSEKPTENLGEFMPAALEVRETAAHPATHYTGATIMTLLVLLLAWAYWGEVDIVAKAEGKIVPLGQVRPVQSAESGVISEILVSEGDQVAKDAVLLRLSPTLLDTEIERAEIELNRLKSLKERDTQLLEFINLNEYNQPLPQRKDAQLLQSFGAFKERVHQLQRQITERQAAKEGAAQTLARLAALEPIVTEQVVALEKLQAHKHVARLDLLAQRERLIELQHQKLATQAQQRQFGAEIAMRLSELAAFKSEYRAEKLALIEQHQSAINSQSQVLHQLHERASKLEVRAPVAGRVKDLAVFTVGAVVGASEQLLTLVPLDEKLEVEAWLANRDIGFVEPGDSSEIKLETFPFTKYGVLSGEVIDLSADATQTDTGLIYKARIALDAREIVVDNRIVSLMPGMGVTAEIRTGKRRVIDYVFDPLMRYRNESLRER